MLYFALALFSGAALIAAYSLWKFGAVRNHGDWWVAIGGALAVAGLITLASSAVRASSFEYTEVFFGVEHPVFTGYHSACDVGDDQLVSNVGVNQHLYGFDRLSFVASYRHHSCAVGGDRYVTDTLGVNIKYRIEWAQ